MTGIWSKIIVVVFNWRWNKQWDRFQHHITRRTGNSY